MLPELPDLPPGLVLDGELVAFDSGGDPHLPALSQRVLHRDRRIAVHLMIFDLLHVDGTSLLNLTHADRRKWLESLGLEGAAWSTTGTFDDAQRYTRLCASRASWPSRTALSIGPAYGGG
jgi:ATP-dependent DNA ligase